MKCPGCNYETEDSLEFEDHLIYNHFIDYKTYSEIELMEEKDENYYCYRCKKYRSPITYLIPDFYYLPCPECLVNSKKTEKIGTIQTISRNIKEYYDKLLGDRYLQLFIVDDKYFKSIIPHNYSTFKSILSQLKLPNRSDIWVLDWNPGYPKILNVDNVNGINVVNLTSKYKIKSDKTSLIINNYKILLPEFIAYDVSHHCRYSILNKTSNRKTKRIRISDSDNYCIKFYNSDNEEFKSIFKLVDLETEQPISLSDIDPQDLIVIKLSILRNKTYTRYIYDIIFEFLKVSYNFRDSVFLKNTILIDPDKDINFNLTWFPEYNEKSNNYINVSIL